MPKSIACPGCRRVLSLPDEAMNALVQCPACQHSFHPAAADTASVRAAPATADFGAAAGPAPPRRPAPPADAPRRSALPPSDAPRRTRRRREEFDICPECRARVPQGANKCPECNVEFESEDTDRPWEHQGEERRDSEPHRGGFLLTMGITGITLSSLIVISVCVHWVGLVSTLVGVSIGTAAWVMGVKDLRKMDKFEMDRSGRGLTQGGMVCGIIGTCLNGICVIIAMGISIYRLMD